MMKIDGRDRAQCQNSGKKGHRCNFENFNDNKDKN